MKLEMLEKLCSEMVENDYTMQHITFSWRQTDINILLAVDGDKYADILMGLSGYDRSGKSLSRLFSYHFERPVARFLSRKRIIDSLQKSLTRFLKKSVREKEKHLNLLTCSP